MLGYVVIVPDYPGFGDSKPYNFDLDRYDSGTIKAFSTTWRVSICCRCILM